MYKNILFLIVVFVLVGVFNHYFQSYRDINGETLDFGQIRDGYKICLIGDSGTGKKSQKFVADALLQEKCDQVRILGDVIYPNGLASIKDKQLNKKFLSPYRELFKNKVPFHIALGNHDYKLDPSVWLKLAMSNPLIIFPAYFWMETYGEVCFFNLDTNDHFFNQLQWLSELEDTKLNHCRFKFAFAHHPRYSVGRHGDAFFGVRNFLDRMLVGFDAYFAGHDHNLSDEGVINGTHHFVSGAAGKLRPLLDPVRVWAKSSFGYLVLSYKLPVQEGSSAYFNFSFYEVDELGHRKSVHSGEILSKK